METRLVIAYALCAVMVLALIAVTIRYWYNRRQFKIRQTGRGKTTNNADGAPAD